MPAKVKFGIEEQSNIPKTPTENFIYKEENKIYRNIIEDAIVCLKEHIFDMNTETYDDLMRILTRNKRNPMEVIKEGENNA